MTHATMGQLLLVDLVPLQVTVAVIELAGC
jgi:hypothetical protein